VRSLYFKIFSASFWITFLSPGIATFINIHVPFSLSRITMTGLIFGNYYYYYYYKDTISFMQRIYTYIPNTNHVPK
jgi:hypothetical protein